MKGFSFECCLVDEVLEHSIVKEYGPDLIVLKLFLLFTSWAATSTSNLHARPRRIVALAFRNGPIENVHAGKRCPTCSGQPGFSRITESEMKAIMKNAVDHVYKFSVMKKNDPSRYEKLIAYGCEIARAWADPSV